MLEPIRILTEALAGVPSSSEVNCVFLAGFLQASKRLLVPLEAFDAAAGAFMQATGTTFDEWQTFLAQLVAASAAQAQPQGYDLFRAYLKREVDAYRQAVGVAAETPAKPTVELTFPICKTDVEIMRAWFAVKKPVTGFTTGQILMQFAVAPVPAGERLVVVAINADGGPCLVSHLETADKQRFSSPPSYSSSEPMTIDTSAKIYRITPQVQG